MQGTYHRGGPVAQRSLQVVEERRRTSASSPAAGSSSRSSPGSIARARGEAHPLSLAPGEETAFRSASRATLRRSSAARAASLRLLRVEPSPAQWKLDVQNRWWRAARALGRVADATPDVHVGVGEWTRRRSRPVRPLVVEARQEPQERRLAGSVRAEHRQPLTGSQVETVDREHIVAATAVADVPRKRLRPRGGALLN